MRIQKSYVFWSLSGKSARNQASVIILNRKALQRATTIIMLDINGVYDTSWKVERLLWYEATQTTLPNVVYNSFIGEENWNAMLFKHAHFWMAGWEFCMRNNAMGGLYEEQRYWFQTSPKVHFREKCQLYIKSKQASFFFFFLSFYKYVTSKTTLKPFTGYTSTPWTMSAKMKFSWQWFM